MYFIIMFFTFALGSSVFSIGKLTVLHSTPLFLTAAHTLLAGSILLAYLLASKKASLKITLKQFFYIVVIALTTSFLHNILQFWALQHLSAAKTCFITALSPFLASLFSYLHLGEKINSKKCFGLLLGFFGFLPAVFSQREIGGEVNFLPEIAMLASTLCSVYGWILFRSIVKDNSISATTINGFTMFLGGLFALLISSFIDSWHPLPIEPGFIKEVSLGIALMTLISNIIFCTLYGWLLKRYTATFLSLVSLMNPILTSITAKIFLGENFSWTIFLSTAILSLSLFIIYKAEVDQGYIVKEHKNA